MSSNVDYSDLRQLENVENCYETLPFCKQWFLLEYTSEHMTMLQQKITL